MGQMFALDGSGHQNVIKWSAVAADIAMARETFNLWKNRGYAFFALDVDDDGDEVQGEKITEFNPELHGIMAVPRMQGG